jgi:hypothetical protein
MNSEKQILISSNGHRYFIDCWNAEVHDMTDNELIKWAKSENISIINDK